MFSVKIHLVQLWILAEITFMLYFDFLQVPINVV